MVAMRLPTISPFELIELCSAVTRSRRPVINELDSSIECIRHGVQYLRQGRYEVVFASTKFGDAINAPVSTAEEGHFAVVPNEVESESGRKRGRQNASEGARAKRHTRSRNAGGAAFEPQGGNSCVSVVPLDEVSPDASHAAIEHGSADQGNALCSNGDRHLEMPVRTTDLRDKEVVGEHSGCIGEGADARPCDLKALPGSVALGDSPSFRTPGEVVDSTMCTRSPDETSEVDMGMSQSGNARTSGHLSFHKTPGWIAAGECQEAGTANVIDLAPGDRPPSLPASAWQSEGQDANVNDVTARQVTLPLLNRAASTPTLFQGSKEKEREPSWIPVSELRCKLRTIMNTENGTDVLMSRDKVGSAPGASPRAILSTTQHECAELHHPELRDEVGAPLAAVPSNMAMGLTSFMGKARQAQDALAAPLPAAGKNAGHIRALDAARAAKQKEQQKQAERAERKRAFAEVKRQKQAACGLQVANPGKSGKLIRKDQGPKAATLVREAASRPGVEIAPAHVSQSQLAKGAVKPATRGQSQGGKSTRPIEGTMNTPVVAPADPLHRNITPRSNRCGAMPGLTTAAPFSPHVTSRPRTCETQYGITPYEHGYSDCESPEALRQERAQKKRPEWTNDENLRKQILAQKNINPEAIFGKSVRTCNLLELFAGASLDKKNSWMRRAGSGDWSQDAPTSADVGAYNAYRGFDGAS